MTDFDEKPETTCLDEHQLDPRVDICLCGKDKDHPGKHKCYICAFEWSEEQKEEPKDAETDVRAV